MKSLSYESVKNKYKIIAPFLAEKERRIWAATEAIELGYGGVVAVSRATGLSTKTIRAGIKEIHNGEVEDDKLEVMSDRQRKPGGGRKTLVEKNPELVKELDKLVEPYSSGDPMSPLRWTCKSTRNLAEALNKQNFSISPNTVAALLKQQGYSLQSNRKRFEGKQHEDRNEQFEYITTATKEFQNRGCPVISVDAKKKELVGNYSNVGQEWCKQGEAIEVEAYDFINKELGKITPYGTYDVTHNVGWVDIGTDNDTAEFAVNSIKRWWGEMGESMYPDAKEILIMADGGGSNGWRNRLWKNSLQDWANEEGIAIMVCHFPPGTSKWNKIEHRMFNHITRNWRGKPLVSHEVIINLIGSTKTQKGLEIGASLDEAKYPKGIKVTDHEMDNLSLERAEFHGEWNYLIRPQVS